MPVIDFLKNCKSFLSKFLPMKIFLNTILSQDKAHDYNRLTILTILRCLLLFLPFLLIAPNRSPASDQLVFTYPFDSPSIEQAGDEQRITMAGLRSMGDPGKPVLPVKAVYILLPPGQKITGIEVQTPQRHILPGSFRIRPGQSQIPLSSSENWQLTPADEKIYSSSKPFPIELHHLVGVWSLCGYRIAVVNLYPVEYIPLTGSISYFPTMELHMQTTESSEILSETQRMLRSPDLLAQRLADLVQNPEQIDGYRSLNLSQDSPKGALVDPSETYSYVIITNQDLEPIFQTLADFKTQRGQRARVVTVEDISTSYTGGDLPEQIRDFILDAYLGWQSNYVLLGGDDEIIPHRGLYGQAFGYTDVDIPSDLYFGALDGNWNSDGDQFWGEPGEGDLLPEVSVGRAPVDEQDEALYFVAKNIQYQQAPVLEQTTEALMAGEKLWDIPLTYGADYKDEIRFGATTNSCTTVGFPPNFAVNTMYDRDLGFPWSGGSLMNLINNGLHLINHVGHTMVSRALRLTADQVLGDLTNDGVNSGYLIIFSQGCYAASFDNRMPSGDYSDDCVAEAFVAGLHGAVAFVGNTRYGWASGGDTDGASQYLDRQFFDALFGEEIYRLGLVNDDSKIDNLWALDYEGIRWCYYEQTLLGDPALDVWTKFPEDLSVTHPTMVFMMHENNFTVQVESDFAPLPGALVCIQQSQGLYATKSTDLSGKVTFTLNPTSPETLDVSVTAHDHLPYLGTALVRAIGPWPWYSGHSIDDDQSGNSSGNGDGVTNHGETIELSIGLKNYGIQTAQNITATLRTADPFVEILDSIKTYPPIPPEGEELNEGSYLFTVSGVCPDGHGIEFSVEARDDAKGTWTSNFSVNVSAPRLVFENLVCSDVPPYGNGNGILEPSESAILMVTVRNIGSAAAGMVIGQISAQGDPYIQVENSTAFFFNTESGSADFGRPYYKITASSQSPPLHFLNYTLSLSGSGGYTSQDSIPHSLGPTGLMDDMEDQETSWTHGGTGDLWHLSQSRAHTPLHSWYCGESARREYQNGTNAFLMSPRAILVAGSVLTFWHWYDLEEDRDFGHVEIYAGTGWIPLGEPFTGTSQGWIREIYDLSAYPSGSALQIRFRLTSDEQNCGQGWYIDDVYVGQPRRFVLDQVQVSPKRGGETENFTFSTTYISDNNYSPLFAFVYIDSIRYTMTTADTDFAKGATFTYQTPLDLGEHQHHFFVCSGLETIRWPSLGELAEPLVTKAIYQQDFENWPGGLTATGSNWEWGNPTSGPGEAHSGQKVWATNLEGDYSNNADARLETPPIDLTGVTYPQLSFWHWFSFEYRQAHYDGGNVKISVDGGDFQVITPDNGYEGTIHGVNAGIPGEPGFCSYQAGQHWHQETFDLSPYSGHRVAIRFHLGTNFRHTYPGWYIDDVAITGLRPSSLSLPAVSGLSLSLAGDDILLSWSRPGEISPAGYIIYRGSLPENPSAEPESLATITNTSYIDAEAAGDPTNYYYVVRVLSLDGEKSAPSEKVGEFTITTSP